MQISGDDAALHGTVDAVTLAVARTRDHAGQRLGIEIRYYPTPSLARLNAALLSIKDDPVQAVSIFSDGFAVQNRKVIFDYATDQRIPVIAAWSIFARSGAICSY